MPGAFQIMHRATGNEALAKFKNLKTNGSGRPCGTHSRSSASNIGPQLSDSPKMLVGTPFVVLIALSCHHGWGEVQLFGEPFRAYPKTRLRWFSNSPTLGGRVGVRGLSDKLSDATSVHSMSPVSISVAVAVPSPPP